MGSTVLSAVLESPEAYEEHWAIFSPKGETLTPDTVVLVAEEEPDGYEGLLYIHQVVDILTGPSKQAGRPLSAMERLRAVLFYVAHDAYIDLEKLLSEND